MILWQGLSPTSWQMWPIYESAYDIRTMFISFMHFDHHSLRIFNLSFKNLKIGIILNPNPKDSKKDLIILIFVLSIKVIDS